MPKFKEGQNVVYIGGDPNQTISADNNPKHGEIVTISYFHTYYKAYVLNEYETNTKGIPQYFRECELREIDEFCREETMILLQSIVIEEECGV